MCKKLKKENEELRQKLAQQELEIKTLREQCAREELFFEKSQELLERFNQLVNNGQGSTT